jgi:hypothetical protein
LVFGFGESVPSFNASLVGSAEGRKGGFGADFPAFEDGNNPSVTRKGPKEKTTNITTELMKECDRWCFATDDKSALIVIDVNRS